MVERQIAHLSVEAAYDRWAATYDATDNPMVFAATRALAAMSGEFAGKDAFEFGCGTGRNLAALLAGGARSVAGCDLSQGMLAEARRRVPAAMLFNHDMMCEALPLQGGCMDLVLFCLALEHVGDLAAPLAQARRLLRAEGQIIVIEIHPFVSQTGVAAHFVQDETEVRMPTFPHRFQDYLAAFARLGLRVAACREWRPCDLGSGVPERARKRGDNFPLVVEWRLTAA